MSAPHKLSQVLLEEYKHLYLRYHAMTSPNNQMYLELRARVGGIYYSEQDNKTLTLYERIQTT